MAEHLQQYDEVQITIGIRLDGAGLAAECYKHTQKNIENNLGEKMSIIETMARQM